MLCITWPCITHSDANKRNTLTLRGTVLLIAVHKLPWKPGQRCISWPWEGSTWSLVTRRRGRGRGRVRGVGALSHVHFYGSVITILFYVRVISKGLREWTNPSQNRTLWLVMMIWHVPEWRYEKKISYLLVQKNPPDGTHVTGNVSLYYDCGGDDSWQSGKLTEQRQ